MKILVCFKAVPCWEKVLDEDWGQFGPGLDISYAGTALNCFDEAALELALRLKNAAGAGCVCAAVTVGQGLAAHHAQALYAAGYDEVVVLHAENAEFAPRYVGEVLADYAKSEGFDLVLAGIQAGMADSGTVPFWLAEALRWPVLAGVQVLELTADGALVATQQGGRGLWRRQVQGPVVLAVGNSPAVLRAVSLRTRLQAKGKNIRVLEATPTQVGELPRLSVPGGRRSCVFLAQDSPEALAAQLMVMLREDRAAGHVGKHEVSPGLPLGAVWYDVSPQADYMDETMVDQILEDWQRRRPACTMLPDTPAGREAATRLAARTGLPLMTGVTQMVSGQWGVQLQKRVCSSNLVWRRELTWPLVLTWGGAPPQEVEHVTLPAPAGLPVWMTKVELLEAPLEDGLQNARVVLACGVGVGCRAACDMARALAWQLGVGFGLSRPAALNGWGRPEEIIGQSGVSVAPDVMLTLGVSGSGAFMAGIEGAGRIIAVNIDRQALVFKNADMGVVADAPALIKAMEEHCGV